MGNNFKNINYSRQLLESLRHYFAVNTDGDITILYKILICYLQVLQVPFNEYDLFRIKQALIAQCKWQIGQLTNLLNYFYDNALKRIFITQNQITAVSDPMFPYDADHWDRTFGEDAIIWERKFNDKASETIVAINVPADSDLADLTATVEKIRLKGIPYKIVTI